MRKATGSFRTPPDAFYCVRIRLAIATRMSPSHALMTSVTATSISLVHAAFRTAQRTMIVSFAATALLVTALVGERVIFQITSRQAADTASKAAVLASQIMLADERLTMSANMAAATGERRWVDRYASFLPDIDEAIAEATELSSPEAAEAFDKETRVANDNLVELERRAFAAVAEGDLPMARSILNSGFYEYGKQSLANGTNTFLATLMRDRAERVALVDRTAKMLLGLLVASGLTGFGVLWLLLRRRLRGSRQHHEEAERRLAHMAQHDELTGLANRRYLGAVVQQILAEKMPSTNWLAVDLNGFKTVNDTLGHAAGDAVLQTASERIVEQAGPEAFVSRIGGDEFVVLLIGDRGHASRVADRIATSLAEPIVVQQGTACIGASVGMTAICPHDTIDEIARRADERMYARKAIRRAA